MFEVEIKSLITSKQNFEKAKESLKRLFPEMKLVEHQNQITHYFNTNGSLSTLTNNPSLNSAILANEQEANMRDFMDIAKANPSNYSLRSKSINDQLAILVLKLASKDNSSANGNVRKEIEIQLNIGINELDELILSSGFDYLSKWSRHRDLFELDSATTACFDLNAGYGYILELEQMVEEYNQSEKAKEELLKILEQIGFVELDSNRLDRMFKFYNANWPEYFGTDKTFTIQ